MLVRRLRIGLVYLFLSALGVTMAFPFFWMVITAFKDPAMVFVEPPQWWPRPWKWDNFARAWEAVPFGRAYVNTVVVTLSVTVGQVFTSSLAAFAFARLTASDAARATFDHRFAVSSSTSSSEQ